MNKTNLLSRATLWMAMILTLAVTSCSSDKSKLLESVPFDAEIVATVNLMELAKQSDLTVEDSRLVIPAKYPELKNSMSADNLETIGKLASAIDLESIVFFGYAKNDDFYATALVKDADKLRSVLKENGFSAKSENGMEVYENGGMSFAFEDSDNQIWFVESRNLNRIEDFVLARNKNNILRYSGLADALTGDNIANLVIDQSILGTGMDNYWSAFSINVSNNAIVAEMKAMSPDGEVYRTDALRPVDTNFLRYIPANFICATAIGLNPQSGWVEQVGNAIEKAGGRSSANEFAEIAPYLKAIDGTIAAGFGPKNKAALMNPESPQQWQAIVMAQMNQSKINELTELLRSNLPGSTEISNGLYSFTSQEVSFTYGSVDGNFAIGMGTDLKPDKQNSFANDFSDNPIGFVFQTPMLNTLVNNPALAYSIKINMDYKDNGMTTLKINLVGTDQPIIPTLITTLPSFADGLSRGAARGY